MVAYDSIGAKTGEIRGPVWAPLPQSPQAAEYLAITATAGNMTAGVALFPDCMNVVRDFNRPYQEQLSANSAAGCVWAARPAVGCTRTRWYDGACRIPLVVRLQPCCAVHLCYEPSRPALTPKEFHA